MELPPNNALYLYCFTRAESLPPLEGVGVDGHGPLAVHTFQEIAAICCQVFLGDFVGPEAEAQMQDLAWLGPRVCRHQEVIAQVMRQSPVLPVRFGTLFSSLGSLANLVGQYHRQIREFLDRVADREEWAVKGFLDTGAAREKLLAEKIAAHEVELAPLSPGMRYLREQRLRTEVEKELRGWLKRVGQAAVGVLGQEAGDFCERRLLSREVTGNDLDMVLNWAFLVPCGAAGAFQAGVEQAGMDWEPYGLVFEASGPWPPYSFAPALNAEPVA